MKKNSIRNQSFHQRLQGKTNIFFKNISDFFLKSWKVLKINKKKIGLEYHACFIKSTSIQGVGESPLQNTNHGFSHQSTANNQFQLSTAVQSQNRCFKIKQATNISDVCSCTKNHSQKSTKWARKNNPCSIAHHFQEN